MTCDLAAIARQFLTVVLMVGAAVGGRGMACAQTIGQVAGDWATPGLHAVVRIEPCSRSDVILCGRLVWVWDPTDVRPGALGGLILRDFSWADAAWRNGTVIDPEDGKTYRGSIRPDGDLLRLKGCAGLFCEDQVWRRLSSIPRPGGQ